MEHGLMFKSLSSREKYAILTACAIILIFIVHQALIAPFLAKRNRVANAIRVQENVLDDMIRLKAEYDSIKLRADVSRQKIENRNKNFTLFSFLDSLSGKAGIKNNIAYMKPSTSIQKGSRYKLSQVEIKLQEITLKQLTGYLHMIETSDNIVYIRRLSISKTGKQKNFINAVLQAETLMAS